MRRREDWPEVLASHLQEAKHNPFQWGANDCAIFVCSVLASMTGTDLAAELRGTYSSREEADMLLAANGGTLAALAGARFSLAGMSEIPLPFAQRGDVVLMEQPSGQALGIVDLDGVHAVSTGIRELVIVPVRDCVTAWRVPY